MLWGVLPWSGPPPILDRTGLNLLLVGDKVGTNSFLPQAKRLGFSHTRRRLLLAANPGASLWE
jgi:hypothetical protein